MKKIKYFLAIIVCSAGLFIATPQADAAQQEYYYCFVTTCGGAHYMTSPRQLTAAECLYYCDFFEAGC
ncbi:MAG: hypothetical protein LBJ63_07520 [Prevotellaceae bacterium]|jgi:hypothetical protein|nr:hypothetical protein [Prevotellaceae bacterium]